MSRAGLWVLFLGPSAGTGGGHWGLCRVCRATSFDKAKSQGVSSESSSIEGYQRSLRALFFLIPRACKCVNVSSEAEVRSCLSSLQAAEVICLQILPAGTFGVIPRAEGLWQAGGHTCRQSRVLWCSSLVTP